MFHHFVIVNKLFIEKFDSFVPIYLFIYFTMMQKIQMQMQ